MTSRTKLTPVQRVPDYVVIIRCIHERGPTQRAALDELRARGLWLSDDQKWQAGI